MLIMMKLFGCSVLLMFRLLLTYFLAVLVIVVPITSRIRVIEFFGFLYFDP